MDVTINEIANNALNTEARKKDANIYISQLIENLINDDIDNIKEYLSKLYKIYLPTTKPTRTALKDPEIWVKQAVAQYDEGYCLSYCYVKDGIMYATNTFRLHYCKTDKADGFYDANFNKVDIVMKYPPVEDIIKTAKKGVKVNQTIEDILATQHVLNTELSPSKTSLLRIKIDNTRYDLQSFEQAIKPEASIFKTPNNVLYIKNIDGTEAVIAPCANKE